MLVHNGNKENILVLASGNAGKAREFAKLLEPLGYTVKLQKELVKFYRLDSQASQQLRVSFQMPSPASIKANITIIDCKGNPTFVTQISESLPNNTDVDKLAGHVGVLMYKKLLEYAQ